MFTQTEDKKMEMKGIVIPVVMSTSYTRYELKREAELNYAWAIWAMRAGEPDLAENYGWEAIHFYRKANIQTLADAAPTQTHIDIKPTAYKDIAKCRETRVQLPDIMHEDVVKYRLGL